VKAEGDSRRKLSGKDPGASVGCYIEQGVSCLSEPPAAVPDMPGHFGWPV